MSQYDFERFRLDTEPIEMRVTEDGIPYPLAGCSAVLSVSTEETPAVANYVFQSAATVDVQNSALLFPLVVTDVDIIGDYYFDVVLTDTNGKTKTIKKGSVEFKERITK